MTARTISAALDALRAGELTATALLDEAITAADTHDEALGIYLARYDESAREAAAQADAIFAAGDPAPALPACGSASTHSRNTAGRIRIHGSVSCSTPLSQYWRTAAQPSYRSSCRTTES